MTKTETYRLIDREGFFNHYSGNRFLVAGDLVDGCFTGCIFYDSLRGHDGRELISIGEFKYFEKVENNQQVSDKIDDHRDRFEAACLARPDFTNDAQLERDGDKYKLQSIQFAYEMYLEGINASSN